MDDQTTQLDRRLTTVEKDVAMSMAEAKHAHQHYATKEDAADLREEIVASELRLTTQIATVDSKLSAQIAALECKILSMESRYLRWTIGTVIAVAGVVLAIARTFP